MARIRFDFGALKLDAEACAALRSLRAAIDRPVDGEVPMDASGSACGVDHNGHGGDM